MTSLKPPLLLTLLTDFGTRDYYVAAVKGTLLSRAPGTTIVDLSHDIAPGDVEEAAFVLSAAAPSFPPGTLHLAVVDPGVGGARAILALDTGSARYLAPDNGLLTRQLSVSGGRAIVVDRPDLYLPSPGATFDGRDRFAPVAAALLLGAEIEQLGRKAQSTVRLPLAEPRRDGETLVGRVAHVDRFGNLVTDLPVAWLGPAHDLVTIEAKGATHRSARRTSHYGAIPVGEAAWMIGSLGTVELALRDASLAAAWRVERGAEVRVSRA